VSRDPLHNAVHIASTPPLQRQQDAMAVVRTEASALLDYCARMGVVLTIEQVPLQPLAMGHYVSRVSVRQARSTSE